jgi:hypothetical protein
MSFYPDVYASGKLLVMTNVTMTDNSAENFGGGLAIGSQALVMEGVTFKGNKVRSRAFARSFCCCMCHKSPQHGEKTCCQVFCRACL